LGETRISDAGLQKLKGLKNLKQVRVVADANGHERPRLRQPQTGAQHRAMAVRIIGLTAADAVGTHVS
jgi:hypothetical protein